MKNVTLTLEEDVLNWARVRAAENRISLSRFLGDFLKQEMRREDRYPLAMSAFLSRELSSLKSSEDSYPRREELYER
jgi:hypothetical protein